MSPNCCPTCGQSMPKEEKNPVAPFPIDYGFDKFWADYPRRNGRRVGKALTLGKWKKFGLDDRRRAYRGMVNYSKSIDAQYVRDPARFLSNDYWKDWVEYVEPPSTTPERPAWVPAHAQWDPTKAQWVA